MTISRNNNDVPLEIAALTNRLNTIDANNPENAVEIARLKGQLTILQNTIAGSRGTNQTTTNNNQTQSVETDAGRSLLQQAKAILSSVLSLFSSDSTDPHAMLDVYTNAVDTDVQGTQMAMDAQAANPNLVEEGGAVVRQGLVLMSEHNIARNEQLQKIKADQSYTKKGQDAAKPAV